MDISKVYQNYLYILTILWYVVVWMTLVWEYFFFFDLFSHFYLQLWCISGIIFCIALLSKQVKNSILVGILFLFFWYQIVPVIIYPNIDIQEVDLYYINANYNAQNSVEIINDIKKYNPKYIAVVELNNDLKQWIQKVLWMKTILYHESWVGSYWVFTNQDNISHIHHQGIYPFGEFIVPEWTIFLIHPFPPINSDLSYKQKINFREIRMQYDNSVSENKFIVWDFNSSVYSKVFQDNFRDLETRVQYTWNRWSLLSIPIDYILGNKDSFSVQTNDLSVSDHSPLLIDFK